MTQASLWPKPMQKGGERGVGYRDSDHVNVSPNVSLQTSTCQAVELMSKELVSVIHCTSQHGDNAVRCIVATGASTVTYEEGLCADQCTTACFGEVTHFSLMANLHLQQDCIIVYHVPY